MALHKTSGMAWQNCASMHCLERHLQHFSLSTYSRSRKISVKCWGSGLGTFNPIENFSPHFFPHAWVSCLLSLSDLLVLFPDTCSTQPTSVTDIGAAIAHPSRESPWELSPSDHCSVLGWAAALGSMTHSDMPQVQREQHTSISDGEAAFLHKEDMVFPVGE